MSFMSKFLALFRRKKQHSSACMMSLEDNHVHTDACFVNIVPLSLVELFSSQGCVSCPPALPNIYKTVLANPNALLLTYNVTYWDGKSGWKDTFAQNQWDQRQKAYATKNGKPGVYTPQVIWDGLADGVGGKEEEMMDIAAKGIAARERVDVGSVTLSIFGDEIRIASDRTEAEHCDVTVVAYNSREQAVKVGAGPNKKKKIAHNNVVVDMMKLGTWNGGNVLLALPAAGDSSLERAVFLQAGPGGSIAAVAKV
ncbi:uncharacterized protein AB675_5461 [Cyphellophora attinorum]|uniref:DUF1223 domain-containing protein n=1 Tax=Cyphellophora attinorum TaxID=1664694 RepID=A0A0N1HCC1_9EURO|nr:uncharacterized protein AB675_5461 [Phialophora attinorum]KPI41937.1 hypothetical protein AB675_5461 [Phialophora attinorum]